MATKKQVRRREKQRRHEWEEVYVDAEGNVVDAPDDPDSALAQGGRREQRKAPARRGRTVQPPSWPRVLKRGLIFAPLMFITVSLLARNSESLAQKVTQTLLLMLVFVPFSYAMDSLTYRMWRKRTGQADTRGKQP